MNLRFLQPLSSGETQAAPTLSKWTSSRVLFVSDSAEHRAFSRRSRVKNVILFEKGMQFDAVYES